MEDNKVLIIEDDKEINELLFNVLSTSGYKPKSALNGLEGIKLATTEKFKIILLDLMLPYKSGEEVLRHIRACSNTPVIVISAKGMVHTKIDILRLGADDYITKPFDIDEVVARIETVLRRYDQSSPSKKIISFRDIIIDCQSKRVTASGNNITLTAMEYGILELLLLNPLKIYSKRNVFESISGEEYVSDENTINVHMSNLRQKLRQAGDKEPYIETIYGMGYRMMEN